MRIRILLSLIVLLGSLCESLSFSFHKHSRSLARKIGVLHSKFDSNDDAVSRRRQRRGKKMPNPETPSAGKAVEATSTVTDDVDESFKSDAFMSESSKTSLEDMFGLGNDQLRELMEQELPVPREDLITRKVIKEESRDKNKVFKLPDLTEFVKDESKESVEERTVREEAENRKRVDRSNQQEYLRVLQLNPFADADDSLFLDEYDMIPSIFGSGKLLNIPVPYLQTGHGILLIITLLGALVYAPGNPLTEFPPEIRQFLRQGLMVTYSINFVLALQAFFNARSKNLPGVFWAAKTFLLGGVAYYEITQSRDPSKINESRPDPADRKSKNRRKT